MNSERCGGRSPSSSSTDGFHPTAQKWAHVNPSCIHTYRYSWYTVTAVESHARKCPRSLLSSWSFMCQSVRRSRRVHALLRLYRVSSLHASFSCAWHGPTSLPGRSNPWTSVKDKKGMHALYMLDICAVHAHIRVTRRGHTLKQRENPPNVWDATNNFICSIHVNFAETDTQHGDQPTSKQIHRERDNMLLTYIFCLSKIKVVPTYGVVEKQR
jgi:hypothetical protein